MINVRSVLKQHSPSIAVLTCVLLYLVFLWSGLTYMLLSLNIPIVRFTFSYLPAACDWSTSVYLLSCAHFLHSCIVFGGLFACKFIFIGIMVVTCMEEIGLRTGAIFGEYYFTSALGYFLTSNLPLLVPFLWFSLSYPVFILSNILFENPHLDGKNHYAKTFWYRVIFSSVILMAYDVISEPIGVTYGNGLWYHAAFIDSATSLDTYVPQPDWAFGRPPISPASLIALSENESDSGDERLSSKRVNHWQFFLDFLSLRCHYDVPIHNFLGWFVTAFIMYSLVFNLSPPPQGLYGSTCSLQYRVNNSIDDKPALLRALFVWTPVIAGLLCSQIFYLLHPCHPLLVRACSMVYVLFLLSLMLTLILRDNKRCRSKDHNA